MAANKFVLKGHNIEVDYTIGMTPGLPALTYKNGPNVKTFKTSEITINETALGSLVSVSLVKTSTRAARGSVSSCPNLTSLRGKPRNSLRRAFTKSSVGRTRSHGRPPSWSCIELHGTAQTVVVPLVAAAVPA